MGKKINYLYAALLTVIFAVVFATQFDPKLHISGDNAAYLSLARTMADGHGYSAMGVDGEYHPASHFPPGYSFILSVFMRAGIDSIVFFKVLNGVFLVASLLLLFFMVNRLTGKPALAFSSVALAVFSPQTLGFATIAMSEMSYMFFITGGFFALFMYSRRSDSARLADTGMGSAAGKGSAAGQEAGGDSTKPDGAARYCFLKDEWFWAGLAMLCGAYYIRSVAMSGLGAALMFFIFRREWKQAGVFTAGAVLLLLPWSLRNAAHGIESRYFGTVMTVNPWRPEQGNISSVGEMIDKMISNFDETVIKGFREILFPWMEFAAEPSGLLSVVAGLAVLALVMFGAWQMGRMRWMFVFYLLGNIALFMLWHGGNGSRYVTPIAPVLFVCFYVGVYYLAARLYRLSARGRAGKELPGWFAYTFLVMALFTLKPLSVGARAKDYPYPPAYRNYFTVLQELDRQAPRGTVVVARKPDLANYMARGIVAVNYKYTLDARELLEDLLDKNATYVILEQLGFSSTMLYLYPAVQQYPDVFPVIWEVENPSTYLLGFDARRAREILGR